ncbi:hypothetical protein [Candidatus Accumulibacter sp. ACC012]|uniref:hypothetical protein n=1 Tax=Candidatus Accumulibacter sp. ACC012 TaxID=2823332 RepID=UPI0025C0AF6B|nr:hypothetical protein [Candidatus Accumulibacter sp. ACC012]
MIAPSCVNGDIPLNARQAILSDGRAQCHIGGANGAFLESGRSESEVAEHDLLALSLATLVQTVMEEGGIKFCPLMPARLGELAELTDLDKALVRLMKHLHEIARRPRSSVYYCSEVSPLSRATRVAPAAEIRLAAHSEDWHRRTLSGVQPKRILALFSEDEWAIYENCVFARLLDRLDCYLRNRVAMVEALTRKYQAAQRLLNLKSEHLYHRFRTSLCELWEEALSERETELAINRADSSMEVISSLAKRINVLRQSELYGRIPRNTQVPEQLRDTNILQHDQHYRHLRELWFLYQNRAAEMRAAPAEVYDRNQKLFEHYVLYVGMLVRRVLSEIRLLKLDAGKSTIHFTFAGNQGKMVRQNDEWLLTYSGARLIIVPALYPLSDGGNIGLPADRIRVYCHSRGAVQESVSPERPWGSSGPVIVNPLEFYGLERIRVLIERFLWKPLFTGYGDPLPTLPDAASQWLISVGIATSASSTSTSRLAMATPLSDAKHKQLEIWLNSEQINDQSRSEIRRRDDGLTVLATCRHCGKSAFASFKPRTGGFLAECSQCLTKWGIFSTKDQRIAKFMVSGVQGASFESHGAWNLEIAL